MADFMELLQDESRIPSPRDLLNAEGVCNTLNHANARGEAVPRWCMSHPRSGYLPLLVKERYETEDGKHRKKLYGVFYVPIELREDFLDALRGMKQDDGEALERVSKQIAEHELAFLVCQKCQGNIQRKKQEFHDPATGKMMTAVIVELSSMVAPLRAALQKKRRKVATDDGLPRVQDTDEFYGSMLGRFVSEAQGSSNGATVADHLSARKVSRQGENQEE